MSGVATKTGAGVQGKAAMALGPLKRPLGIRYSMSRYFRKWTYPAAGASVLFFALMMKVTHYTTLKKYTNYYENLDPYKLDEELKEYGVYAFVKPSWKE